MAIVFRVFRREYPIDEPFFAKVGVKALDVAGVDSHLLCDFRVLYVALGVEVPEVADLYADVGIFVCFDAEYLCEFLYNFLLGALLGENASLFALLIFSL